MTRKLIVTKFHLMILGLLIALTVLAFYKVPVATGLPVHWGLDGKPDAVWPRDQALLIFPIIGVVLTTVFALAGLMSPTAKVEAARQALEAILAAVLGLFLAIQLGLMLIGVGSEINMIQIIGFAVGLALIGLGFILPNALEMGYSAVRLPWALKNGKTERRIHRVSGVLFIIAGLGLGVMAFLGGDPRYQIAYLFVGLLVPAILSLIVSRVLKRD